MGLQHYSVVNRVLLQLSPCALESCVSKIVVRLSNLGLKTKTVGQKTNTHKPRDQKMGLVYFSQRVSVLFLPKFIRTHGVTHLTQKNPKGWKVSKGIGFIRVDQVVVRGPFSGLSGLHRDLSVVRLD